MKCVSKTKCIKHKVFINAHTQKKTLKQHLCFKLKYHTEKNVFNWYFEFYKFFMHILKAFCNKFCKNCFLIYLFLLSFRKRDIRIFTCKNCSRKPMLFICNKPPFSDSAFPTVGFLSARHAMSLLVYWFLCITTRLKIKDWK